MGKKQNKKRKSKNKYRPILDEIGLSLLFFSGVETLDSLVNNSNNCDWVKGISIGVTCFIIHFIGMRSDGVSKFRNWLEKQKRKTNIRYSIFFIFLSLMFIGAQQCMQSQPNSVLNCLYLIILNFAAYLMLSMATYQILLCLSPCISKIFNEKE